MEAPAERPACSRSDHRVVGLRLAGPRPVLGDGNLAAATNRAAHDASLDPPAGSAVGAQIGEMFPTEK